MRRSRVEVLGFKHGRIVERARATREFRIASQKKCFKLSCASAPHSRICRSYTSDSLRLGPAIPLLLLWPSPALSLLLLLMVVNVKQNDRVDRRKILLRCTKLVPMRHFTCCEDSSDRQPECTTMTTALRCTYGEVEQSFFLACEVRYPTICCCGGRR
jgi:hypothetical protein